MSSTNSTMEGFDPPAKPKAIPFVALMVLAMIVCAVALIQGNAPFLDPHPMDWIDQARIEKTWAGVFACGFVLFVIGLIGTFSRLFSSSRSRPSGKSVQAHPVAMPSLTVAPARQVDETDPSGVAISGNMGQVFEIHGAATVRPADNRRSLKFDATHVEAEAPAHTAYAEMPSLEPAIFHDNASDSFLSQTPLVSEAVTSPEFDARAALSDTHGLNIGGLNVGNMNLARGESAQIIPFRQEPSAPAAEAVRGYDPLEAALLAEPMAVPGAAPQSDMNAVISSAMRFIETPVDATSDSQTVNAPADFPEAARPEPVKSESEIRQAVQTALSVWPDSTRAIAADELSVRIAHLYYDPTPQSHRIFQMIASGDLGAAASALQTQAGALADEGRKAEAAELWRVCGALHMGRDDSKAMTAYEKVSELDPTDANIHLYLARRYQMAGEMAKQPAVISRALAVISDPSIRTELLTPYADLQMKAGHVQAAGDALEELSRLHETTAYLRPDDVAARSAHAISVARLAQAREMQGAFDQAGPLYKRAYRVFSELSAMKPEHPGLKAMADNALKDAKRFGA